MKLTLPTALLKNSWILLCTICYAAGFLSGKHNATATPPKPEIQLSATKQSTPLWELLDPVVKEAEKREDYNACAALCFLQSAMVLGQTREMAERMKPPLKNRGAFQF